MMQLQDNKLQFSGDLDFKQVPGLWKQWKLMSSSLVIDTVDLHDLHKIDSSGVAFLDEVISKLRGRQTELQVIPPSEHIQQAIGIFSSVALMAEPEIERAGFFENLGNTLYNWRDNFMAALYLTSDIFYWSWFALFNRKGQRKGSFMQQTLLIGMDSLPIIGLLSFIIGLILALQSAAQLKLFGANVFLADLMSISMVREMGPLITAIILAGRTGSAIASEIATMQVTEEIDALKIMALNPIRYIVVPKFHAFTVSIPILVTFSIFISMFGGFIIATLYLGMSATTFIQRSIDILVLKDVVTSLSKSIVFVWAITIIGSYFGFKVKGGAEGVGKATTESVVASIFAVIVIDAIFSLVYLG